MVSCVIVWYLEIYIIAYARVSQPGVLEPQGVSKKFQGVREKSQDMQIMAGGYANYDIGGTRIRKIKP